MNSFNFTYEENADGTLFLTVSGRVEVVREVKEWVEANLKPLESENIVVIPLLADFISFNMQDVGWYGVSLSKKSDLMLFKLRWDEGRHTNYK